MSPRKQTSAQRNHAWLVANAPDLETYALKLSGNDTKVPWSAITNRIKRMKRIEAANDGKMSGGLLQLNIGASDYYMAIQDLCEPGKVSLHNDGCACCTLCIR